MSHLTTLPEDDWPKCDRHFQPGMTRRNILRFSDISDSSCPRNDKESRPRTRTMLNNRSRMERFLRMDVCRMLNSRSASSDNTASTGLLRLHRQTPFQTASDTSSCNASQKTRSFSNAFFQLSYPVATNTVSITPPCGKQTTNKTVRGLLLQAVLKPWLASVPVVSNASPIISYRSIYRLDWTVADVMFQ